MENESFYDFSAISIDGENINMSDYKGKVVLIVNTASKCGFTPQLKGLESLFKIYRNRGFVVIGFPCNQFANQDPGDEKEIKEFCSLKYDVTFPMFAKIDVNGEQAHPLFKFLKNEAKGIFGTEIIKWNFTKFLVNKNGEVIKRFAPKDQPETLAFDIEKELNI